MPIIFNCACRFNRSTEFSEATLMEPCAFHSRMAKDAARYRFLRENDWDSPIVKLDYDDYHTLKGEELDAAVDAAIIDRIPE